MFKRKYIGWTGLLLVLATLIESCVMGTQLITSAAKKTEIEGTYTLMLYGCRYQADIKNLAILVADGSKYPLEIYDLDTSYTVKKGVAAQEALAEAESFLKCSSYIVQSVMVKRISDGSGGTLGFEIRPLYLPIDFGTEDVMNNSYSLRDGMVRAYIRLDPQVERAITGSGLGDKPSHMK